MPRALVVEDERNIRDLLQLHLELEGVQVVVCVDGTSALRQVADEPYDIIVLDLMLPGIDGLTVCKAIRRSEPNRSTPVLILTARREESDTVLGLDSGADDYLTKPFGVREFVARVRALLRRPARREADPDAVIERAGVRIDRARRLAWVDGTAVELTPNEFDVLYLLAASPGIVFSRDDLLAKVWPSDVHVTERSVDSLIKRLRQKVDSGDEPVRILTVWGTGYKFTDA